jgi:hypothetical protein
MKPGEEQAMLAAGRSPAAADTGAKDSNGKTRSGSHSQAADARPALTQSDDIASAIAEFRPPAAPWQIRYRKQIVAGMVVVATVGASMLGMHLWRTLGPSRLDEVKVVLPEDERNALRQDATPAPLPVAPKTPSAVDVPQKRSDPVATGSRAQSASGTIENRASRRDAGEGKLAPTRRSPSAVTHTKGADPVAGASPTPQQPSARVQDRRPASQVECSEAVAALNLCASPPSAKAAQ